MNPQKNCLVWIDLEMTGLAPETDHILEIASLITDNELTIIAEGPSIVIAHTEQELECMSQWVKKQHGKTGLIKSVLNSSLSIKEAEQETLNFIKCYCKKNEAPLCGNSVWQDRAFLSIHMSSIIDYLHYRLIDVSSIKELVKRWYPNNNQANFKKPDNHRALEDIKESVAELAHYKQYFFK